MHALINRYRAVIRFRTFDDCLAGSPAMMQTGGTANKTRWKEEAPCNEH
jgi:hypothetical protein